MACKKFDHYCHIEHSRLQGGVLICDREADSLVIHAAAGRNLATAGGIGFLQLLARILNCPKIWCRTKVDRLSTALLHAGFQRIDTHEYEMEAL